MVLSERRRILRRGRKGSERGWSKIRKEGKECGMGGGGKIFIKYLGI